MEPVTGDDNYAARYVAAVTRSLPPAERGDHARELRASIQDQIEGRIELGETSESAEVAVLNALGDPLVLSARYADRPLHLIGPQWYPSWRRVLRVVLWSALPPVAFAVVLAMVLEDRPLWGIIGPTLGITLSVGAWIFTVMTIIYAAMDRAGGRAEPWTVEQLPVVDPNEVMSSRTESVVLILGALSALVGLVVVTVPWNVDGVGRMSVLNPALWPWSLIAGVVLILAAGVVALRARMTGEWGLGIATASAAIAFAWAVPVVGLAVTGNLFDPAFVEFLDIDHDARLVIVACVVAGTLALAGWSVFADFRRALRHRALMRQAADAEPRASLRA